MADIYLDIINGNDANGGTGWGDAKLTPSAAFNAAAANDRIKVAKTGSFTTMTGTFNASTSDERYGGLIAPSTAGFYKTGNGFYGMGSYQVITAYNGASYTYSQSYSLSGYKHYFGDELRGQAIRLNIGSGIAANTKTHVMEIDNNDFSNADSMAFWIYPDIDAHAAADQNNVIVVALCSDTAGDVELDSFTLDLGHPVETPRGFYFTRNFGAALPSNVASVKISTGAVAGQSMTLYMNWLCFFDSTAEYAVNNYVRPVGAKGFGCIRGSAVSVGGSDTILSMYQDLTTSNNFEGAMWTVFTDQLEYMPSVGHRFQISDYDVTNHTLLGWSSFNIYGKTGIHWEGGYNTSTDLVDGFTEVQQGHCVNDIGFFKASGALTTGNTVEFSNWIFKHGHYIIDYSSATSGLVRATWNNCYGFGNMLKARGANTFNEFMVVGHAQIGNPELSTYQAADEADYTNAAYTVDGTALRIFGDSFFNVAGDVNLTELEVRTLNNNVFNWNSQPTQKIDITKLIYSPSVGTTLAMPARGLSRPCSIGTIEHATASSTLAITMPTAFDVGTLTPLSLAPSGSGSGVMDLSLITYDDGTPNWGIRSVTMSDYGTRLTQISLGNVRLTCPAAARTITSKFTVIALAEIIVLDAHIDSTTTEMVVVRVDDSKATLIGWDVDYLGLTNYFSKPGDVVMKHSAINTQLYLDEPDLSNYVGPRTLDMYKTSVANLADLIGTDVGDIGAGRGTYIAPSAAYVSVLAHNGPEENLIWRPGRYIASSTVQSHSSGPSWKVTPETALEYGARDWKVASVAVKSGVQLTASCWVYVTAASYIKLYAPERQLSVSDPEVSAESTNQQGVWEQVSFTMTPSDDGILEFYIGFKHTDGNPDFYIDDINFSQ